MWGHLMANVFSLVTHRIICVVLFYVLIKTDFHRGIPFEVISKYTKVFETYSRIILGNLQSYCELLRSYETYSCIGLLRSYENLRSYWTTTKLWKNTVVLDYYEAIETYIYISFLRYYYTRGKLTYQRKNNK